jgi:RNA polymerase sigma-70 factor (ECF subfamily)
LSSQPHYTEAELIALLKQRQQTGFAYLYDHYSTALNGIILTIVHDQAAAEDVLQEVFVRIFRKIEQYDANKSRLYTWVAQIARNAAIDWTRKEEHQPAAINQKAPEDVPHGTTGLNADLADMHKWINQLARPEQEVIVLAYLQGYTQEEISERLAIPLGTVKSRVRSGLLKLRKMMSDQA